MRHFLILPTLLTLTLVPDAQRIVRSRVVLDDGVDSFQRCWGAEDGFGSAMASLGDLNGDGSTEFAIGASGDQLGRGAVWIFSLTSTRSVRQFVKIGPDEGGIEGQLDPQDRFGSSVAAIGDLDQDGTLDLAVGAPSDDDGFEPPFSGGGALWVLLMNPNGTVREFLKFSQTQGALAGRLDSGDGFGTCLAAPGDLDGNGFPDLLVGAPGDDDGGSLGSNRGALWIVLFQAGGDILALHKLSGSQGGGGSFLSEREGFGTAVAAMGDLDGDGRIEVAVGSDRVGLNNERLRLVTLAADGSAFAAHELTGLGNVGRALARVGDLDGNGVPDLAAGDKMLRLSADGNVIAARTLPLIGSSLAGPGDTDGDGFLDLVVGVPEGAGFIEFMDLGPDGVVQQRVSFNRASSGLPAAPDPGQEYGACVAPIGDLDGDGQAEIAIGAPADGDGGLQAGAVWIHFIDGASGARVNKLSRVRGALPLDAGDRFGDGLAPLGDLDGNGSIELAVGAPGDSNGGFNNVGAVYVLFLRPNGTVQRFEKIGLRDTLGRSGSSFGRELAQLDDLDGDGRAELAVATNSDLYVLSLDENGRVRFATQLDRFRFTSAPLSGDLAWIERTAAAAGPYLAVGDTLGRMIRLSLDATGQVVSSVLHGRLPAGLTFVGDLDGDGIGDLAHVNTGSFIQSVAFEFLTADFASSSVLELPIRLVRDLGPLGDLTGDGVRDLAAQVRVGNRDRVLLLELDGIATASFERRDALDNLALENGRQIPRPHPGRTFVVSSEGANLGAAIFDSTPGGPNATSQDPDLLVGSGNVLMLQDSLNGTQSEPGLFDRPNDDRDGGLLALDLPRPVRALSLELIDQDSGLGHGTTVTLIDENGRTRTYDVPPGFTEDVNQTHVGGWRTLRLDTLAPQPGYASTATAAEQPGFLASRVRRVEVQLSGSGAIDDFLYDPWP